MFVEKLFIHKKDRKRRLKGIEQNTEMLVL